MAEISSSSEAYVDAITATGAPSVTGPVAPPLTNYTVFLNHRGPDVKKSFVDHLATSLESVGVRSFVDNKDLHVGDDTWDAIESAIRRSKVHIAIFSPGYALSTWCLRELHEILECRTNGCSQLFLPVFFKVHPSDLRYSSSPKSCYSEAFVKLQERHEPEVVVNWRNALHQASMVTGFTLDTAQGFEARLVKLIVYEVVNVLNRTLLDVAKHPVGVKEKLQEVLDLMENNVQHGLHKLVIHGMGGVGKTTLAKSIYNGIYRDFDGFCFIESVRSETKAPNGLRGVQERILHDILKNEATIQVPSTSQGKQIMRDRFSGLKILLILDDIDDREQLEVLLAPCETCHLKDGSQVVITTRDEQIVIWAKPQKKLLMEGLSEAHSHLLFNWHAFLRPEEPLQLKALAKKVVDACQGLPLALETLGAHLYGNGMATWKATVKVLEGNRRTLTPSQRKVTSILRISYDGLGNEEQLMFLDVACFMLGESEARMKRVWCESDAAELCLETLRLKSLVRLDHCRRLTMHDHLRDMGREIVDCSHRNVWQCSHLWDGTDVRSILQRRKGASKVRAVRLALDYQEEWNTESFAGMDSLKFLLLSGRGKITGDFGLFPKELRWFEWHRCPLKQLPHKLDLSKVAVLDLKLSDISSLSNGHMFENLRELRLSRCEITRVERLPDFRVCCKKLEVLDLSFCYKLESVPESISCLSSTLTHLDLSECHKLTTLPDALVRLNSLKLLRLDGCLSLTRLPDAIGQLTALEVLGLEDLRSLVLLPQSLGNLTELTSLRLLYSVSLVELPSTIGNLRKLSSLGMRLSSNLKSVPESIEHLSSTLTHLDLCGCEKLTTLPDALVRLNSLKWLRLDGCSSLTRLPEKIGNLQKLVTLNLSCNRSLSHLPSSIGQLAELVTLDLHECNIGEGGLPEELLDLSSLRELDLGGNPFSSLPEHLHLLSELRTLKLYRCGNLRKIPRLPSSLEVLVTASCENLREIPTLPSSLKHLTEIPGLVSCPPSI